MKPTALTLLLILFIISSVEAKGPVSVRGYTRKDGTYVRPHTRSAPSSRSPSYSPSYNLPSVSVPKIPPAKTPKKPKKKIVIPSNSEDRFTSNNNPDSPQSSATLNRDSSAEQRYKSTNQEETNDQLSRPLSAVIEPEDKLQLASNSHNLQIPLSASYSNSIIQQLKPLSSNNCDQYLTDLKEALTTHLQTDYTAHLCENQIAQSKLMAAVKWIEMGKTNNASIWLHDLVSLYPDTDSAQIAKELLSCINILNSTNFTLNTPRG